MAVHPSDTAPALIALNARVVTTKRTIRAEDFFSVGVSQTTVLDMDEVIIKIVMPQALGKSSFIKYALRQSIDFPIVNCAAMVEGGADQVASARVCLNAVYVKPYRAFKAEEAMAGKPLTEETAEAAGKAVAAQAKPLQYNAYMVPIAKTMVKRALLGCA